MGGVVWEGEANNRQTRISDAGQDRRKERIPMWQLRTHFKYCRMSSFSYTLPDFVETTG